MGLYNDWASERPTAGGKKIREDGEHRVRVDKVKVQESQQGFGAIFVVEYTVLESDTVRAASGYAWTQFPESPGVRGKKAQGNIVGFVGACMGKDLEEIVEDGVGGEDIEAAIEGRFNGTELILRTRMIETKAGHDYCVRDWFALDPAPRAAAAAPPVPPAPKAELTREAWLAGEGPGQTHESYPGHEFNPDHPDWGWRTAR